MATLLSGCASVTPHPVDVAASQWIEARIAHEGAERRYRLFVPSGLHGPRHLPLVVMLHGCTQNPEDFATGTEMNAAAEREGVIVAYPEQPVTANPRTCWNWFDSAHQKTDAGEPALIAAITRAVISSHVVDSRRVYVAGISAGGAMAAIMGATYPELYTGVGVHSGVPFAAATTVAGALAAMQGRPRQPLALPFAPGSRRPALILIHGDADVVVSSANPALIAQQWQASASNAIHDAGATGGREWKRWRTRDGRVEAWSVSGLGHAWSGGNSAGTFADAAGPPASDAMLRFFLAHASSARGN